MRSPREQEPAIIPAGMTYLFELSIVSIGGDPAAGPLLRRSFLVKRPRIVVPVELPSRRVVSEWVRALDRQP